MEVEIVIQNFKSIIKREEVETHKIKVLIFWDEKKSLRNHIN